MKSGAEQLRDWVNRRFPGERPQRDAANHFGWTEKYISLLVNGKQIPGLQNAIRIEEVTGIPVEAWIVASDMDKFTNNPLDTGEFGPME